MPFEAVIQSATGTRTLAEFTRPALVVPQLLERDTPGIIKELSEVMQQEGCVRDLLPFYHAALNRELLENSALACGIAIPHARLSGVQQLQFALGRVPEPLLWGAGGIWPVQLVFLVAVPATDAANYLHLLASLARLGQQPGLVAELRAADTAEGLMAVLGRVRMR